MATLLAAGLIASMGAFEAALQERVDALWPNEDELGFMRAGWRLNLWEARREAQQKGKPLFLWMMNGHPTGCT